MSWGLGWKRPSEVFHLALHFGEEAEDAEDEEEERDSIVVVEKGGDVARKVVEMEWTAGDDEDQVALRLQSKLMVEMPPPEDTVVVELEERECESGGGVAVEMKVVRRREPLRAITMAKAAGSGQQSDGIGVLTRLLRSKVAATAVATGVGDGCVNFSDHWNTVTALSLCGCGISVLPVEVTKLPLL